MRQFFLVYGFCGPKIFDKNFVAQNISIVSYILRIVLLLVKNSFDELVIPVLILFILLHMLLHFGSFCLGAERSSFTQILSLFFSVPVVEHKNYRVAVKLVQRGENRIITSWDLQTVLKVGTQFHNVFEVVPRARLRLYQTGLLEQVEVSNQKMRNFDRHQGQVKRLAFAFVSYLFEIFVVLFGEVYQLSEAEKPSGSKISCCIIRLEAILLPKRCFEAIALHLTWHMSFSCYSFI